MEPMVSATHQRLKRARIEQDLDSKIKNRPGPLELIEGSILKAEHFVEQAVKGGCFEHFKHFPHLDSEINNNNHRPGTHMELIEGNFVKAEDFLESTVEGWWSRLLY